MTQRSFFNKRFAGAGMARMKARRAKQGPPKKGMNKAEARYAAHLSWCTGVVSWKYEGMKFRIGDNCWYTPDFMVELEGGRVRMVDVKAAWKGAEGPHMEDDSTVKIRSMAEHYGHWFEVVVVWLQDGEWREKIFEPRMVEYEQNR